MSRPVPPAHWLLDSNAQRKSRSEGYNLSNSRTRRRQPALPALCFLSDKRILKKAADLRWALGKLDSSTRGSH